MINAANTTMRKCRYHGLGLFVPPDCNLSSRQEFADKLL
jgi:hypothetical protein